ncbi:prolyl oligopeptidase family serine peptidase [Chryseobacterium sp. X308]|uniref:prolyl oligopeptidase family serine peptidase n=1 Tax=Chryseobacterium sp. X308 TaxID=2884873 RepID=UPI001D14753E|nr:prolyl oligopeptidase family serine peptidase [Chryseobacterium sp. X308]MCC3216266.1 prolyl oligopeptidase family serine peptidase [Chryseobacterium sp. X308]
MKYIITFLIFCNHILFSQTQPVFKPTPSTDQYFERKIIDEYRNIENVKDSSVIDWMKGQNNYANFILQSISSRQYLIDKLGEMDSKNEYSISYLQITDNDKYFYLKRQVKENIPKLYVRNGFNGKEELLFTSSEYKKNNKEYVINYIKPNYDGSKIVVALTEGGKEIGEMIIIDVEKKNILPYTITHCWPSDGGGVSWLPDNSGFIYLYYPIMDNKSDLFLKNMAAVVYKIGDDPEQIHPILSRKDYLELNLKEEDFPIVSINKSNQNYLIAKIGGAANFSDTYYAYSSELNSQHINWKPLYKKEDKVVDYTLVKDDLYYVGAKGTKNNFVAHTSLKSPNFSQSQIIINEMKDEVIGAVYSTKDGLFITTTKNGVEAKFYFYNSQKKLQEIILPISAGNINLTTKSNSYSDLWVTCSGWNSPDRRYKYNVSENKFVPENVNPIVEFSDFKDVKVLETTAKSHDGKDIPLSIIYNKELKPKEKLPLLVLGYGAYSNSYSPFYARIALLWAIKGGIVAYTHVRGGGEKGEEWHLGGFKKTKPNSWKDFISCIEFMHEKGYSNPSKTAIWGISAGGIIVGRTMTERPDLIKAVIVAAGTLNTVRGEASPNGANSVKEFGTVKDKDEFGYLYEMDSYLHIKKGVKYPATLITTGYNDPRVPVWMSAKFAAKLIADNTSNNPILLKVDFDGGHGRDNTKKKAYEEIADIFAFALWQLGHPDYQPKESVNK